MSTLTDAIAIIPAKGNSVRIPNKNIRDFCGQPMILYGLRAITAAGEDDMGGVDLFGKVVVATDSDAIGSLAAKHGAVYYKRKHEDCTPEQPMIDVILEVLEAEERNYKRVLMVYPCAPFIGVDQIQRGYELLVGSGADVVMPIFEAPDSVERSLLLKGDRVVSRYPEYDNTNSEAFAPTYHSAGQWYWGRVESLRKHHTWMCPDIRGVVVNHVVDIDTMADWERAEWEWRMIHDRKVIDWAIEHRSIVCKHIEMERDHRHGIVSATYQDGRWQSVDSKVTNRVVLE